VKKTGRVIIYQEDSMFGGVAIFRHSLWRNALNIWMLGKRVSLDTPIPFTKALEDQYLPKGRFETDLFLAFNFL
jgi:2-oxoisovalerate dehydrogenase E1 component